MGYFTNDNRAAPRYAVDARVHGSVAGQSFDGHLQDVSESGAAVTGMPDVAFDNNQFVQLHMEGIGHQQGYVRRGIPGGFALEFEMDEDDKNRKREFLKSIRALGPEALRG